MDGASPGLVEYLSGKGGVSVRKGGVSVGKGGVTVG